MPQAKRPRAGSEEEPETTTAAASGEAAGSSTGSSAGSERVAANGFFSDPGPGFDEEAAARAPEPEPAPEVLDLAWHEETVRGLLEAQGAALHAVAGKAETDWVYTRDELRAIAGPLTRILNRYPATQAAAGSGDELAVLIGVTGYTTRSIRERQAALKAIRDQAEPEEEQPLQAPVFTAAPDQPPIPPSQ